MNEYFLVTWDESGDETHFILLPMSEYNRVNDMRIKLRERKVKVSQKEIDTFLGETYDKVTKSYFTQTYCSEDWPFGEYNIKKLISLPVFGW